MKSSCSLVHRSSAALVLLLVLTSPVLAADKAQVSTALGLVKKNRFEEAIPQLKDLVYSSDVSGQTLVRVRIALAQSYYYTSKIEPARYELRQLFGKSPDASIDANRTPPDFLAFFNSCKADVQPKRRSPQKPEPKTVETKVETRVETRTEVVVVQTPASQPTTPTTMVSVPVVVRTAYVSAPWYLKILPFGIGQFANGDPLGGGLYLGITVALVAANVVLAVINTNNYDRAGGWFYPPASMATYIAQDALAGAAFLAGALGVVDAFVWSPARGQARFDAARVAP